jgi:hypothetical protein
MNVEATFGYAARVPGLVNDLHIAGYVPYGGCLERLAGHGTQLATSRGNYRLDTPVPLKGML